MNHHSEPGQRFDILYKYAETNRFSNGSPVGFKFVETSPDVHRLVFLRSTITSSEMSLWTIDPDGNERLLVDASEIVSSTELSDSDSTENERRRRTSTGITSIASNSNQILFGISGQLFVYRFTDDTQGVLQKVKLDASDYASAQKFSPNGTKLSYLCDNVLHVLEAKELDWEDTRAVTHIKPSDFATDDPHLKLGVPEFVAAEEMGRYAGYWWVTDELLLVTEVDESNVALLNLSSPDTPTEPPRLLHYPYSGTANAKVSLWLATLGGGKTELMTAGIDASTEYFVGVRETEGALQARFQDRAQTTFSDYNLNLASNQLVKVNETKGEKWIDIVPNGFISKGGHTVEIVSHAENRSLVIDGQEVKTSGYVRKLIGIENGKLYYTSSPTPSETHFYSLDLASNQTDQISDTEGINDAVISKDQILLTSRSMENTQTTSRLTTPQGQLDIEDLSANPDINFEVEFGSSGRTQLAIFKPNGFDENSGQKLPILFDPYGGPHAQRVIKAARPHIVSQWFADQGYLVVVADGPGTPGVSEDFEFAVYRDLVEPILDGQISALEYVIDTYPYANADSVGIRGWSFGGYLSALACIQRPDLFHAGVAGAPVTDWELYDTHYTERYLGTPHEFGEAYKKANLVSQADKLKRPLMLIHGLSDDNVVPANSLKLSHELFINDIDHELVTVSGLTHMPKRSQVVVSLIKRQIAFLDKHLKS